MILYDVCHVVKEALLCGEAATLLLYSNLNKDILSHRRHGISAQVERIHCDTRRQ